jgi:2-polyprenyl-3-methyl-5-hydroxy-6-metoxy-1,4-benzoquinol methylase
MHLKAALELKMQSSHAGSDKQGRLEEAQYILSAGRASASPTMVHLQSEFSIANYIRIADEVAARIRDIPGQNPSTKPRVLDWGAGIGQMSYLLSRRNCAVSSFDIGDPGISPLEIDRSLTIQRDNHPSRLPYDRGAFDVVLSCGVLEHVPDEEATLDEIHRVLRPGGLFLIYNLPQRFGYTEFIVRAFHLGYTHERRYGEAGTRRLFARHGFAVRRLRRSNMLPHNFRGLPALVREALTSRTARLLRADLALSSVPLLNRISGMLELDVERLGQ